MCVRRPLHANHYAVVQVRPGPGARVPPAVAPTPPRGRSLSLVALPVLGAARVRRGVEDGHPGAPHRDELAPLGTGRGAAPGDRAARRLQLVVQVEDGLPELLHLLLQLQDPLDPGEVDALLLGEPLHLAQEPDVAHRVAPTAAGGPARPDQAQPVVLAQRLRVQAGEFRGDRGHVDRDVVADAVVHRVHAPLARASRPRRGSWSEVAARYFSNASRASGPMLCGTCTSTVTSRSPRVPSRRREPLPRTRRVRPLGVPGGIFTVTGTPLRVGTRMSAPSTASG